MSTSWYNRGLYELATGQTWTSGSLKILILSTSVSYTFNKDHDFVSDVSASEASGGGYSGGFSGSGRKTLSSATVTLDDTNDRIVLDAADVSWLNVDAG